MEMNYALNAVVTTGNHNIGVIGIQVEVGVGSIVADMARTVCDSLEALVMQAWSWQGHELQDRHRSMAHLAALGYALLEKLGKSSASYQEARQRYLWVLTHVEPYMQEQPNYQLQHHGRQGLEAELAIAGNYGHIYFNGAWRSILPSA